jgi:hypothetical protein
VSKLLDVSKRTTLTLDDDVAARLEREAHRTGAPYREVVNQALRRGLEVGVVAATPYRVETRRMQRRPGQDVNHVAGLLDQLDGPHAR